MNDIGDIHQKRMKFTDSFSQGASVLQALLSNFDWQRLSDSIQEEHLYREALEIEIADRSIMGEHNPRNEGNNILDCY
jgi:predicted double-glycine peptidase